MSTPPDVAFVRRGARQESLKQVRSCCNRTDPDWSGLLSRRLQSLESDLEGRLQGFAATIRQGASLDHNLHQTMYVS